jgi:acyl-CoA thioester hydrolase
MKENNSLKLNDFTIKHQLQTRFRDVDAFQHINNAVFLSYFEDARKPFFNKWSLNLRNRSLIVASIKIDYFSQLKHPSTITIGQKISRIGKTSFDVYASLFLNDEIISSCITTIVCYDFDKQKSIDVYDEIKQDFNLNK